MKKYFEIKNNKIIESAESEHENSNIHIYIQPDDNEKRFLIDNYSIDEHTLHSCLDPDELARFEMEPNHIAIIYKRPKNYSSADMLKFKVASTGVFLFKNKIIIVLNEDVPLFTLKQFLKVKSVNDLMLKLLYSSISHFIEHLKVINFISDDIEQKINKSIDNKYLINLFSIEKSLIYYLYSVNSNKVLMDRIKLHAGKMKLTKRETQFLDDIIIENEQCYKQAEIISHILGTMGDARASIVNNNLNMLIKRLTIITIIFLPLNLLSGIGGMSEYSMMTKDIDWKISYAVFTIFLVIIAYITYYAVNRSERKVKKK